MTRKSPLTVNQDAKAATNLAGNGIRTTKWQIRKGLSPTVLTIACNILKKPNSPKKTLKTPNMYDCVVWLC